MFNRKIFDSDKMFEKFMDMSGEECKAMLFGVLMGIGLSDMMNEKDNEETPRRSSYSYTPEAFKRISFLYKDLDEARDALDELKEAIIASRHGFITVQNAINITGQNFYMMPKDKVATSFYGWDDLDNVFVALDHRYRGEGERWMIRMPQAKPIDPCPQPEHAS